MSDIILPDHSRIFITFQKEGIHKYPAAETDPNLKDVSFLAFPHRHIFHFKVSIQIFHDDRELEFILVKRKCQNWLNDETLHLDFKSCEMIAQDLYNLIHVQWPNRAVTVEVSEDGENGATLSWGRK